VVKSDQGGRKNALPGEKETKGVSMTNTDKEAQKHTLSKDEVAKGSVSTVTTDDI
jgi:hypothetical protein